jgi:hypothetical protein
MGSQVKIVYSGFWDRPLAFVVRHRGIQLYFRREFDEHADDYQDAYRIFVLPNLSDNEINASWGNLHQKTTRFLGQMPVKEVVFDPSFRESVSTDTLDVVISKMDHSH